MAVDKVQGPQVLRRFIYLEASGVREMWDFLPLSDSPYVIFFTILLNKEFDGVILANWDLVVDNFVYTCCKA